MATAFQASYNGLTFGAGVASFPSIAKATGLNDMPPVRSADENRSGDHGAFQGVDLLAGRTVELEVLLAGTSQPNYDSLCDQFQGAFAVQPAELPLAYTLGDTTQVRVINCRPRKTLIPRETRRWGMTGMAAVQLFASDPRKYAQAQTTLSTGLATQSGGMTFNATFPLSFGSVGAGGTVNATNAGNFQTPLTFTITGPVVNPIVDNLTTGQSLLFLITLGSTDTLVIAQAGTSACSIVLNGTASRRNALLVGSAPLSQFGLPGGLPGPCTAGVTQQFRYRNNGAFTASTLQIAYQSAWI